MAALKSDRLASWLITLDDHAFAGSDRVRIKTVRVWLEGAKVPAGTPVRVWVATSGQYRDRLRGNSCTFTTKALSRAFDYKVTQKQTSEQGWWQFAESRLAS